MADSQNSIGGRYQIITPLGKGGMGIVYKAYDPVLDRTVAIKKMAASIVDHEEFRQRFFVEARAVARLNHPNIVTIHELEEDEGGIYIVMEMLDGVSLSAVMKNGISLSRDTQVTLLSKVASGLDYAHQRGVVHRDIKPANLMLTMSGGVKILDFGIARFATSEMTSMGGSMLGTPHYMSPEQIEGKQVDARADWFSYGAVAYELVARQKPFDAPSVPPLLMKITSTMHVPLIDVAPDTVPPLSAIVDKLLAKNRDDRPSSGADVQCALTASGDTNREDLIASVVKSVLGDAGDVTIIQPMSARGMTGPMIAAKPSALVIPGSTSTTPVGLPPGSRGPGMLAPSDPTQSVTPGGGAPGSIVQPPTVALPDAAAAPLPTAVIPPGVPAGTSTIGIAPPQPSSQAPSLPPPIVTAPITAIPSTTPIGPIGSVSSTTGTDLPPAPTPPPIVSAPPPPAPNAPVAVASSTISTGIPAKKSSLKGALIVVLLLLFVIGASGAAAVYWWATHTASGQFALNSLLGRKPEVTTASTTTSPTDPGTPSSSTTTPSTTAPTDSTSPGTSTPGASTQPTQPGADSSTPSSSTPGTSSLPSSTAPGDSKPATEPTSTTPPPVESSSPSTTTPTTATPSTPASPGSPTPGTPSTSPSSTPGTAPRVADATPPSRPPATEPREPRTPTTPRTETPRRSATPAEPLPPERGPVPPPPADDEPRVASRDNRAPLDQATVDAFKGSRGSSAPSGYGNIDSPMMQASVVRIKDTLESYSQAIEHQDLDALKSVREPISAAESAQVKSDKPTIVHFSEVEVKTDGKTATVVARRNITVGGANKFNGFVEIRLSRRPGGWVITDIR